MAKTPKQPQKGRRPTVSPRKSPSSRTITVPPLKTAVRRRLDVDEQTLHAELGKLVRSWANLHEFLASILAKTLECDNAITYGMWHSIKSDLVQRDMLASALKAKIGILESDSEKAATLGRTEISTQKDETARLLSEYLWVIGEITAFSHKRNDLIHSPIVFYHDGSASAEFEAIVSDIHHNPRATRLKNLELFQLCGRANAFILTATKFIASLGYSRPEHAPLPSRPQWPSASQFPTRKQQPHQKTKRRPMNPPRSSQA